MIPYDDLVVALQTWRARQGLPVAQLSGVAITPPPAPSSMVAPVAIPKSNPPAPPPRAASATPPPLAPAPDTRDEEFDEGALLEEAHYENEGDDFALAFNGQPPPPAAEAQEEESTSIGSAPGVSRDSFGGGGTEPEGRQPQRRLVNADLVLAATSIQVDVEGSQGCAAVGRVSAAGEHAQGLLGKRVLIGPLDPCGECETCRRGGAAVCPSAIRRQVFPVEPGSTSILANTLTAAARWAVPLEDGLDLPSPAAAAIAGDIALAYTLYARTGPSSREPCVIAGASPIARFLVEILLAKGIAPIVLVDPALAGWGDWLRGKNVATATDAAGVTALLATDGVHRARRVIAATTDAISVAADLATPRSTLTVLAPVPTLPGELASREVTIIPVAGAHPDLVVEVAAMCAKREIDLVAGTGPGETADMRAVVIGR